MLRQVDQEASWFRVVDAATALAGRGYDCEGQLSIEVLPDTLTPWNDGIWQLDYSPDGTKVTQTTGKPDLTMSSAGLSALFTGTKRVSDLVHFGLVQGEARHLHRYDQVFATRYAAHCPDHY